MFKIIASALLILFYFNTANAADVATECPELAGAWKSQDDAKLMITQNACATVQVAKVKDLQKDSYQSVEAFIADSQWRKVGKVKKFIRWERSFYDRSQFVIESQMRSKKDNQVLSRSWHFYELMGEQELRYTYRLQSDPNQEPLEFVNTYKSDLVGF